MARLEADIRDMYEFKEELQQMLEYQKGTSELDDQLSFKVSQSVLLVAELLCFRVNQL